LGVSLLAESLISGETTLTCATRIRHTVNRSLFCNRWRWINELWRYFWFLL